MFLTLNTYIRHFHYSPRGEHGIIMECSSCNDNSLSQNLFIYLFWLVEKFFRIELHYSKQKGAFSLNSYRSPPFFFSFDGGKSGHWCTHFKKYWLQLIIIADCPDPLAYGTGSTLSHTMTKFKLKQCI